MGAAAWGRVRDGPAQSPPGPPQSHLGDGGWAGHRHLADHSRNGTGRKQPSTFQACIVLCRYCLSDGEGQKEPPSPYGFVRNSCWVEGVSTSLASCFSGESLSGKSSGFLRPSLCPLWANWEEDWRAEGGGCGSVTGGQGTGVGPPPLPSLPSPSCMRSCSG